MKIVVLKFGGTSVGTIKNIKKVAKIIESQILKDKIFLNKLMKQN